tara:strand:+ start:144 stop:536 length:393 start_codon:yes stop_codon:yes gene_type:complete
MGPKSSIKCGMLDLHTLFGKKWTYGLLHNIDENPVNYNRLYTLSNREINPTLLSERLKELVKFKIINRETIDNKICYSITKEGNKLKELLQQIKDLSKELSCYIPEECKGKDCSGCREFKKINDVHRFIS